MNDIKLELAMQSDIPRILEICRETRRDKISKAAANKECFKILHNGITVGVAIVHYYFFENGFIDLIVIGDGYRRQGLGGAAVKKICGICRTKKLFTSTNASNGPMRGLLEKLGFKFAGEVVGLDDGDPELFYYKKLSEETI